MDDYQKQKLEPFLEIWARHMADDFAELRQLLYPSRAVGTYDRLTVVRNEAESDSWAVLEVLKGAIGNLTVDQLKALELDQGLRTVANIDDHGQRLGEALQVIWRALVAHGFFPDIGYEI